MSGNYWDQFTSRRVRRRMLLRGAAVGGLGMGALSLIGCGGSNNSNSGSSASAGSSGSTGSTASSGSTASGASGASGPTGSSAASSLISKPIDSTAQAVKGGVLTGVTNSDVAGFDAYPSSSLTVTNANDLAYNKFFKATLANRAKGESPVATVEGDLFESFEVSPDLLTITGKLRKNAGLDPRPPTNGRNLDIKDVQYTWNLISTDGKTRGLLLNSVSPTGPITSMTTPDDQTVVFKLAFPSPSLLPSLAFGLYGNFIYPVEADGKYDPKSDMRGAGPWMLDKYEPSAAFHYKRNPNYYLPDKPILDGIDYPIIPEYASELAQFRTGSLYTMVVNAEDQIQTKKDNPGMVMQEQLFSTAVVDPAHFSFLPNSKWLDDRLRQAFSMTIDRDLLTQTIFASDVFEKAGIPIDIRWNTVVGVGESEYWLDPKSSEFGPNAKYFQLNLSEATKLVNAATGSNKVSDMINYPNPPTYGPAYQQAVQIIRNMANDGPFDLTNSHSDYASVWSKVISGHSRVGGGHDFQGVAIAGVTQFPEVDSWFAAHLEPGGPYFKFEEGYPPADDQWYQLLKAQQVEPDHQKRISLIKQFQQYAAGKMYIVPTLGAATTFQMAWGWAGNFGAFEGRGRTAYEYLWFDQSKKTS